MSKITQCGIYATIDSYITVTNADNTTVTFTTPSTGKDHDAIYTELRTLADAYIASKDAPTEPESTFDQHIPVPTKLNGIDGDTYVICETEQERDMVMEVCKGAGFILIPSVEPEHLVVKVSVSDGVYYSLSQTYYKDVTIPASRFLALNTPNPSTHSANIV